MKKAILLQLMVVAFSTCAINTAGSQEPANPNNILAGYNKYIRGEIFSYHSLRPDVTDAMLVRAMGKELYIEWESEPLPSSFNQSHAQFILMVNINVQQDDPHSWEIMIDGRKEFTIKTPGDRNLDPVDYPGREGYSMRFEPVEVDKYGDMMGYLYISVPGEDLKPGNPVRFTAVGESANSRSFFIVYRYTMKPGLRIIPEQAIRIDDRQPFQQIRVVYTHMGSPGEAKIDAGGVVTSTPINFGYNSVVARIPVVREDTPFVVTINMGKVEMSSGEFMVSPVAQREIHLLHHSHVDIGYTHVQDEVEKIQWGHLENAIRLAEETRNNPPEARFRWNAEVMWPVGTYLENHPGEKGDALRKAIKRGDIEMGSTFAHMLSELCNTEELVQVAADARKIAADLGITSEAAMITDVPGWSWGMVPVLARSGVKYLSLGTNHGHRIGTIMEEWGDRPFWWVSPSGEEKLLCWIHLNGYSMFHTGVSDNKMGVDRVSERIFGYLNQLYERGYPYRIVPARYSIGADNGPTDPDLAELVMEWNSIFETPKLKISTVSETFREFEKLHGTDLPVVSGAFTGYWEDGAASSSMMTGLNREAAGNVNIASSLAVITGYDKDISGDLKSLWNNVLLYDEHTWGSWNSISDPEDPFTLSQWSIKSSFARQAATESIKLRDRILGIDPGWRSEAGGDNKPLHSVEVINTHSWDVTQPVEIPSSWNPAGHTVTDENGMKVTSQLLSTGNLLFIAGDIPATGSRIYFLGGEKQVQPMEVRDGNSISNSGFILEADTGSGAITSLYYRKEGRELVDNRIVAGLNSATYVEGRSPDKSSGTSSARIKITDDGELVKVIEAESELEGCNSVKSRYTIIEGLDRVFISTVIDKKKIYSQEGLHIGFPFRVEDPEVNIDLAFAAYRPEADQAPGACKNYYTAEHWIDVSNQDFGVTVTSIDAPLFEIGNITTDATAYGWIKEAEPSALLWSYVMNNYWETNYLAGQEGEIPFRYVISPHGPFNSGWAERTATAEAERLVIVPSPSRQKGLKPLVRSLDKNIIVTAIIPSEGGYLLRIFNAAGAPSVMDFSWGAKPTDLWITDFEGNHIEEYRNGTPVPAWGIRTIRVYN